MRIKRKELCRGNGVTYISIDIFDCDDDSLFSVKNHLSDKTPVPLSMVEPQTNSEARTIIIRLPTLTTTQHFVIAEHSRQGVFLDKASFAIYPRIAKWVSRINYKFLSSKTEEMKRLAAPDRYKQATVEFISVLLGEAEDKAIVRCETVLPNIDTEDIEIQLLDEQGKALQEAVVFLRDEVFSIELIPTEFRRIEFSTQIPRCSQNITVEIRDKHTSSYIGFDVLEKFHLELLLNTHIQSTLPASSDPLYGRWSLAHSTSPSLLHYQRNRPKDSSCCFSIIIPLFETPIEYLCEAVNSVINQSYENWELILVNASPNKEDIRRAVQSYTEKDARIQCVNLEENYGITENTNRGIARATGDFVCFADHDDMLELDALYEYMRAIEKNETTDLLYCDEDILSVDGCLKSPLFKPPFSLDTLHTGNYVTHFLAIRKTVLDKIGPQGREYDGAQDFNLTLLVSEQAREVHHVPKILYHWRESPSSTALNPDSKPYASTAGKLALENHFSRMGIGAEVVFGPYPFSYGIDYKFPRELQPLVSILIPTKDNIDLLDRCLSSILHRSTYQNFEIVLIENNSTEHETFAYYEQITDSRIKIVIWEDEWNFAKINNFGAQHTCGDYLLFLNNDTEVISSNWIENLLGICQRDEVGAVGAKLFYPDDTIQHAGVFFAENGPAHLFQNLSKGNPGYLCLKDRNQTLSAVTAACMMTKRKIFESVKGFDEQLAIAYNDVDYCLRIRSKGMIVVYASRVELYHFESLSRGLDANNSAKKIRQIREKGILMEKWASYFGDKDPCINPNIDRNSPYYALDKLGI